MAVKVIASPSQNVDEETDDAKAVEVKLTIGFSPTLIVIPGEIEEQPPPVACISCKRLHCYNLSIYKGIGGKITVIGRRSPTGLPSM